MATVEEILSDVDSRMQKSLEALRRELNTVSTGRANPSLVENVLVEYYGVPTPLNQVATISVPEARVLMIQPWDKQSLKDVEKGVLRSDMGLVPNNDGSVIRINIPVLTEERRRELVRLVGKKAEDSNVALRNVRRDGVEQCRKLERDKEISQDENRRAQDRLQQLTDAYIDQVSGIRNEKETEVMEV